MPRRRKNQFKIPIEQVRNIVIFIFVIFLIVAGWSGGQQYLTSAPLFVIKSVNLAPSLQFINSSSLDNLPGKNIFSVDLRQVEKKLRAKYPQIKNLKVERSLPDQIQVLARQREPLAQINLNGQYYSIDKERVPLSSSGYSFDGLPLLANTRVNVKLVMGAPLRVRRIKIGLEITSAFRQHPYLSRYKIEKIDLDNLSKIIVTFDDAFDVVIDRDKIQNKVELLGALISQHQLPLNEVEYFDLRFKEPIVGKKK